MRKLLFLLLLVLAVGSYAKTLVAVVETKAEDEAISSSERRFVTDKLREIANKILPADAGFSIMTRENIEMMLPPGKTIGECEGSCLAETGRNIAADFIAQARVGRFGEKLTLTVEMYETKTSKLVSSFTGTSPDTESLLDVIESDAERFFKKARKGREDAGDFIGPDGFSDYSDGESYSMARTRSYIVQVKSNPAGALLSVDGKPVPSCKETPCKIQLEAGEYHFVIVADQHFQKDTLVEVQQSMTLNFKLKPRFGLLDVSPTYEKEYYINEPTYAYLNGDYIELGVNRLNPGSYNLKITNNCYEPVSASVTVKTGSQLTFDKKMKVAKGGLSLSATRDDVPAEEPVFVDGNYVGKTPYDGEVPVCATITIGANREVVPVTIPYHDEADYTYQFASRKSYETSYSELDEDYGYAPQAVATKPNRTQKRSESIVAPVAESSGNSINGSGYFQVLAGIGFDLPLSQTAFDDTGLNFMLGLYYVEVFAGWKFSGGFFAGLGAGLGIHDPFVMDSSSSDGYSDYYGMSEDVGNSMLPSPSLAGILSVEMGNDFTMNSGYKAAVGFRASMVFSSWPAISISGFFEILSFAGMEVGFTTVTGDDLWDDGTGISMRFYFRFPSRPGV
ncbi:PEGA domain-containing protein [Fibrobacter sp. UWEL]|uniref:PEGA domain-containing protein n=1 Tax=Fibrobacter sp. UWEL TaxID=1896209 RepID=UPI0009133797|nr:PEGA domain-containing protein [Fibrobacter sp. UWEL]SHK31474.1 PEGA domain-containing protein [Fibrobacter sp. UWEL]